VGPSDLTTILENVPPYRTSMRPLLAAKAGDPQDPGDREFFLEDLFLCTPTELSGPHHRPGSRWPPGWDSGNRTGSCRHWRERGARDLRALPDEGHGYMLQENSLSFSVIDAALLGKLLVGQAEPIGRGFSWLKSWHPHRP